ncbi:MAG: hypothetical protein ACTHK7_01335, partial [Aureliella sp.]
SGLLSGSWAAWLCLAAFLTAVVGSLGCSKEPGIRQYTVPKEGSSVAAGGANEPREMLGAIVPEPEAAWFFKLMGEPAKVDQYKEQFRQLVDSFSVDASGTPKWKLPEQWTDEGPSEFVDANLRPPGEKSLKVTISQLPMPTKRSEITEAQWREYVAANVNRWRRQLQLPEQSWDDMAGELQPLENLSSEKAAAYLVNLEGHGSAAGPMGGMAASGGPMAGSAAGPMAGGGGSPMSKPAAPSDIQYTLPEGWREVEPLSIIAIKSFKVDGPEGTEASATFTSAGGDRVSNVARWNSQVGGSEEQLAKALESSEKLTVNGVPAEIVFLSGSGDDKQAIMAATIEWNSQNSLFVKLWGPAEAVEPQREAFLTLVKSLKW